MFLSYDRRVLSFEQPKRIFKLFERIVACPEKLDDTSTLIQLYNIRDDSPSISMIHPLHFSFNTEFIKIMIFGHFKYTEGPYFKIHN